MYLFNQRFTMIIAMLSATVCLSACQKAPEYGYIEGETMGTSYHIRFELPKDKTISQIQADIDKRLVEINKSMSTYDDSSTITRFNHAKADEAITIDADFVQVMADSKQVYQASDGAFNPTVMPLVRLWGFGGKMTVDRLSSPPTEAEINQAKTLIDFDAIIVTENTIKKTKDDIGLDFSAVAKGYGVDAVADVLKSRYQIQNYMVEIGGEVATRGKSHQGQPWQLGVDIPTLNSTVINRETIAIISNPKSGNLNLATSGNYRNSLVLDGIRYSHTIDPITGQPVTNGASSVTIAHETTSLADAWATALTAMPYAKALKLATDKNLAVMFVIPKNPNDSRQDNLTIKDWQVVETPAMKSLRAGNN